MIESVIFLIIALFGLYKANEVLVEELEKFAVYSNISTLAIGFIFLAVATSIPELSMAIISSILKKGELGLGTAMGNIIYDLLLVLPIVSIWYGINTQKEKNEKIWKISAASLVSLFPLLLLKKTSFFYGMALILVFVISSRLLFTESEIKKYKYYTHKEKMKNKIKISTSLILTIFFSYIVVTLAKYIVEGLGISATFFGAIVVSLFSCSPELFSSLVAARRKEYGLIYGSIFGTVLFDSTFVPGISMIFSSYHIESHFYLAYLFLFISIILVSFFLRTRKRLWISEGLQMLFLLFIYIISSIFFI